LNNLKITRIFGFFAVFVFALFLYSIPSNAGAPLNLIDNATGGNCIIFGNWDGSTKTCTLTTASVNSAVTFFDNDITLDCNGKTIQGSGGGIGITIDNKRNIVVKRCIVDNWSSGIRVFNRSNNILLFKNNITNCDDGIALLGSTTKSNIIDNVVDSSVGDIGFSLTGSSRSNNFINNVSNAQGFGFRISSSNSNTFIANTASGGTSGFHISDGSARNDFTYNISTGNAAKGFFITNAGRANIFKFNIADGNDDGFFITSSSNNTFEDNIADNNTDDGFEEVNNSSNNTFIDNDCNGNTGDNSSPPGLCNDD